MATPAFFYLCVVLLLLEITSVDRIRVGGSKSTRGSRSRNTGRSYGEQNFHNVVLSGRIITGSSPFTSTTWRSAAIMGTIYGGRTYIKLHPKERKLPPICTNNKERSPEGRAYGYFICPREVEPEDFRYCCGTESREYCCNITMAQIFYSEKKTSSGTSLGITIGVVVAFGVITVVLVCCCKKRKQTDDIVYKRTKKEQRSPQHMPLHPLSGLMQSKFGKGLARPMDRKPLQMSTSLQKPTDSFENKAITPHIPPPSYNAATTTGFDAVIHLTFMGQQLQQAAPVDAQDSPQPSDDETTILQTNRPHFSLPAELTHSTTRPSYLTSSPNSSRPPDIDISFHPLPTDDPGNNSSFKAAS